MPFKFNDSAPLADNLAVYAHELAQLDAILALQLSFCFEVSPLRGGLVCSAPD